jgi:hypothetical protein
MVSVTNCTRCGGFIIPEPFRDIGISTIGWHCLLCGETVDDVILQNRARPYDSAPVNDETTDWQSSEDECELGADEVGCEESVFDETLS